MKCLSSIMLRMSSAGKSRGSAETLPYVSTLSSLESNQEIDFRDPYGICSIFGMRDIGSYKHLYEIEADSINPNRKSSSFFLVHRLK